MKLFELMYENPVTTLLFVLVIGGIIIDIISSLKG